MKRRSIFFNPEQSEFLQAHGLGANKALKDFIRQHYPDFPQDNPAGNPNARDAWKGRTKLLKKDIDN